MNKGEASGTAPFVMQEGWQELRDYSVSFGLKSKQTLLENQSSLVAQEFAKEFESKLMGMKMNQFLFFFNGSKCSGALRVKTEHHLHS